MSATTETQGLDREQPLDATGRAEARRSLHYVASHGTNRVCATDGCDTRLSRYNKAKWCWVHDPTGR